MDFKEIEILLRIYLENETFFIKNNAVSKTNMYKVIINYCQGFRIVFNAQYEMKRSMIDYMNRETHTS